MEHTAISVLTHSYCVFSFSTSINHIICTYVHLLDMSAGCGFSFYISNKIPCPSFCCTDLDFTVFSVVFMADEVAFRCNVTPQGGFIPEEEDCCFIIISIISHYKLL